MYMNHNYFILSTLENFLVYELQPDRIAGTLAKKPASEWIGLFEQECRGAIQNLKACRYQLSAADFLRHMQLTYADTLDVIGCLRNYERRLEQSGDPEQRADLDLFAFYPALVGPIKTVLVYIEGQSSFCYDPIQLVPAQELEAQLADLRQQNLVLRARYKSRDIEPALQQILNEHLDGFLSRHSCSYQELQYTRKLMGSIGQCLAQSRTSDYSLQLISRLICLNFNKTNFYEYVKASITQRIEQEQRPERKSSALRFYSKEIQTLLCKPHLALKPDSEAIQASLLRFLAAELDFYTQSLPDGAELPATDAPAANGLAVQPAKLQILTNVHELGMWMQLLMQVRMIANDAGSVKDWLRFVCGNFRSIGSERISMESLSRRLYDKDPRVAAKLKEKLLLMIEVLDRDYLS
jgi:hypothetical protein